MNEDKWKRSFNNGCVGYSDNFESAFVGADQTWQITRIMAYISGCASLIAVVTSWLLTVTPLPASFFWPGVLLPASILAMLTGGAKFLFFDAKICSEELWFADPAESPVAPQSCNMGDSAVYAVASVAAYFLCTILICVRSPTKRTLDPDYGGKDHGNNAEITLETHRTQETLESVKVDPDPELGVNTSSEIVTNNLDASNTSENVMGSLPETLSDTNERLVSPPPTKEIDISQAKGHNHVRTSSDVTTWTTNSAQLGFGYGDVPRIQVLSPAKTSKGNVHSESNVVWDSSFGVFMTVDGETQDYLNGKTHQRSNKSPESVWNSPDRLPRSSIRTGRSLRQVRETDSVCSKISKVSFAETQVSDESFFYEKSSIEKGSVASSANSSAPYIVSIPKKNAPSPQRNLKYISASPGRIQPNREDRNDAYSGNIRLDTKRDRFEHLPPLNELSSPKSNDEDHGELINQCLKDLQNSYGVTEFGTI